MMIDDGNYGLSQHTLTAIVVSVAYNVFESAGKVEKKKKNRKEKITRRMFDQPRRVDTYKSSQANQVTRGFTRVSSDRQPRYYESSN